MSFFKVALVSSVVLGSWEIYLLWRQRGAVVRAKSPPKELEDTLTQEDFEAIKEYGKDSLTFEILDDTKDLLVGLGMTLYKVPSLMYKLTQNVLGLSQGSFSHCYAYTILLELISECVSLPCEYYRVFVVEEKHGFNKNTRKNFFLDSIKSFVLKATLLHPLQIALIRFVVQRFGEKFPIYFFAGSSVIVLGFMTIFPTFIMPLYNKFTLLDKEKPLVKKIQDLATSVKYPLTALYEMDGSRRSAHSNAFLYGMGRNKRIVLFDTLLERLNDDQVVSVVCHELGHWYHGHTIQMLCVTLLQLLCISSGAKLVMFNQEMYREFGFDDMNPVVGFELYSEIFLSSIMTVVGYGMMCYSRRNEFQADEYAVSKGYGELLKSALLVLTKENKATPDADPLYAALHQSHPSVPERIRAMNLSMSKRQ